MPDRRMDQENRIIGRHALMVIRQVEFIQAEGIS